VKLQQSSFEIQRGNEYALHFRARADAPRRISSSVGQNHEPFRLLSPYFEVEIERDWRRFEFPFTAIASDPVARIAFDLAESDAPVELTDVVLRDLSNGGVVATSPQFFVSYRFNSLGFRGPDYAIPPPDGTFRILALGDSYTLGEGVHEQDTFSAQLESRLNAAAGAEGQPIRYEVINSGVGGYSTEQERLSYELFSSAYMPQVVVLTMVFNDDLSFAEEVRQGHFTLPEESPASNLWARFENLRRPVRTYDYSTCVRELLLLEESCRRHGARLAVVIFRQSIPPDPWLRLLAAVNEGVEGTGIPVLDLGHALAGHGSHQELIVHPNDGHPNEIAHRVAAEEIERFLRSEGLLPGASSRSAARSSDRPAAGDGAPRGGFKKTASAP
jgi:lysophospholipase L1-like esterase